jgi:hypothetical protein
MVTIQFQITYKNSKRAASRPPFCGNSCFETKKELQKFCITRDISEIQV